MTRLDIACHLATRTFCLVEGTRHGDMSRPMSLTEATLDGEVDLMSKSAMDVYLTGLRNHHAVETQAIGTLQNEMTHTRGYPELHARMRTDKERSTEQAARLDRLLDQHGSIKSPLKEAVAGAVATMAGFAHVVSDDDVLKNVLAAIGYKAYEIASYKALVALAEAAGAEADIAVLEQSMNEEQEMGDWLGEHLPDLVNTYLHQAA